MAKPPKVIEQLRRYDPAGVPVTITFHSLNVKAKIIRQMSAGRPIAPFLVELNKPIGFEKYVEKVHLGEEEAKKIYEQLLGFGCIDDQGRATCLWMMWTDLEIIPKRMALTEYTETDPAHVMSIRNFPGRIVGTRKNGRVVLLEVFEPVPFIEAPESISAEDIEKGFYSQEVYVLGIDTYRAWARTSPETLPPGELHEKEMEYRLDPPIPIKELDAFCKKHFPGEPMCVWQGVLLYIVPIDTEEMKSHRISGAFRPMRLDLADYYAGAIGVEYESEF
jgi:hypothetical protein